jgi:hypothetical protein
MSEEARTSADYIAGMLGDLRGDAEKAALGDLAYLIALAETHAKEIANKGKGFATRAPRGYRARRSP